MAWYCKYTDPEYEGLAKDCAIYHHKLADAMVHCGKLYESYGIVAEPHSTVTHLPASERDYSGESIKGR